MRKWSFVWLLILTLALAACGSSADNSATAVPAATSGATAAATARPTTAAAAATSAPATGGSAVAATPATRGSAAAGVATNAPAASAAPAAPAALSGDPIPIGLAVAQTSNAAAYGQDQRNGAAIAEKYFNDHGGINGRPVKIVLEDTAGDEQGAINAFQAEITKDKVAAIIGPTLSQQALAADPKADAAKVPVVGPSNTDPRIPGIGEYIRRVSAPVNAVAPSVIKFALKQNPNIKNVAVLYAQNDAFSMSETQVFQDTLKQSNLNIVTVQKFQTTDTDFTTQISATLALKPDLAVISGLQTDGGNLVKQLRDLGFKGTIIGGNGFNSPSIFPICKAQCDGILVAQAYSPLAQNEANTAFSMAYMAQYNTLPSQFAAQSFTAVQVVVEALRALDSKTKISSLSLDDLRVALNKQLNDTTAKYATPLGDIAFDMNRELIQNSFYVAQVKMNPDGMTGKFTFVM